MSVDQILNLIKLVGLWTLLFVLALPLLTAGLFIASSTAWGLRYGVSRARLDKVLALKRLLRLWRLFAWPVRAFTRVYGTLGGPMLAPARFVVDERLKHLKETMLNVRDATRDACSQIEHLGKGGHAALETNIRELDRRTNEVASLGGSIDEDLVKDYEGRSRSTGDLIIAVLLMAIFLVANGVLMNLYIESWIQNYIFGVPVSFFVSVAFVALEFGAGWLIALNTPHRGEADENGPARWFFIAVAFGFSLFEGFALGTLSAGWDWDLALFDAYPWTRYWLAIVGLIIVPVTAGVGFQFDMIRRKRAGHIGALRLRREIKEANRYVDELPRRWQTISDRARSAVSSIESYGEALGGKAEGLKGSVDRIKQEREAFATALAAAKFDDWDDVLTGNAGDQRQRAVVDFGLLVLAVAAVAAFTAGLGWVLQTAFGAIVQVDPKVFFAIAGVVAVGLAALGFLPFQRLQLSDGPRGRTFPLRNGNGEYAIASVVGVAAAIGLVASGMAAFGWVGAFAGLLLVVGGALMVLAGYFFERIVSGLLSGAVIIACVVPASGALVLALIANLAAWPLAAIFWLFWAFASFLARPVEWLHEQWVARRARKAAAQLRPLAAAAE